MASNSEGVSDGLTVHFSRNEFERRLEEGQLDLPADVPILPNPHRKVIRHLTRGAEMAGADPRENEVYRRVLADGVELAVRDAIKGPGSGEDVLAYLRGYQDQDAMDDEEAADLLTKKLEQEAMTTYVAGPPDSGKTHGAAWLLWLGLSRASYETGITNVPLEDADLVIPSEFDDSTPPELEWQADPELVEAFLEWHLDAGLPLDLVVARTEEHMKAVCRVVDGRSLILVDEYGTSGGGAKNEGGQEDHKMTAFVKMIRKDPYLASIVIIGHEPKDIGPGLRNQIKLGIEKETKRKAMVYGGAGDDGFTDPKWPIDPVPQHEFGEYDDKDQPPWAFDQTRDDDDEDDDGSWSRDQAQKWAQARRDADETPAEIAADPEFPYSESWVYKNTTA